MGNSVRYFQGVEPCRNSSTIFQRIFWVKRLASGAMKPDARMPNAYKIPGKVPR